MHFIKFANSTNSIASALVLKFSAFYSLQLLVILHINVADPLSLTKHTNHGMYEFNVASSPECDAFLLSFKMIIPLYVVAVKWCLELSYSLLQKEVNNMLGGWSRRQEDWSPFMQHLRASNNTLRSAYNNLLSTHTALGGHLVNGHYACHNCFNPYHLRLNRIVITLHLSSSIH